MIRNISLAFLGAVLSLNALAQLKETNVNWIKIDELEAKQKEAQKKVLIDVYTKWCGPCKMMMKNTFHNPEVVEYINKNYYAVKFDAESGETVTFKGHEWANEGYVPNKPGRNSTHDLTLAIASSQGRIAYPTIVYMDEGNNIIFPVQGYYQPKQIMPLLSYVATDAYETKTFDEYKAADLKE